MHILKSFILLIALFHLPPQAVSTDQQAVKKMSVNEDAIKGAVMGAALGDALGRVTEFIDTTKAIKRKYGSLGITSFKSFKESDWVTDWANKVQMAAYTDDTVMALLVLKTACKDRALSLSASSANYFPSTLGLEFALLFGPDAYNQDPLYDIRAHGPTNICASKDLAARAEHLHTNSFWWTRGKTGIDFMTTKDDEVVAEGGCGSVMRAWPIGLIYWDQEAMAAQRAYEQSILTHRHPMAIISCAAITIGIAHAVRTADGGKESPQEIVQAMINTAQEGDASELLYKDQAKKVIDPTHLSASLIAQDKLLTSDMLSYAALMAKNGIKPEKVLGAHNEKQENYRSTEGFLLGWAADEALAAAVYIFLRHPTDMQAALIEAVNTPGDSDSVATLVGALVGANIGFKAFERKYEWHLLENFKGLEAAANQAYKAALISRNRSFPSTRP